MIRDITSDDLPTVLALNNAHAMEVNALTADALDLGRGESDLLSSA